MCDQCIRLPGCVQGSCIKPYQCICYPEYYGPLCDHQGEPISSDSLSNIWSFLLLQTAGSSKSKTFLTSNTNLIPVKIFRRIFKAKHLRYSYPLLMTMGQFCERETCNEDLHTATCQFKLQIGHWIPETIYLADACRMLLIISIIPTV